MHQTLSAKHSAFTEVNALLVTKGLLYRTQSAFLSPNRLNAGPMISKMSAFNVKIDIMWKKASARRSLLTVFLMKCKVEYV